jgi:hypothetical protein
MTVCSADEAYEKWLDCVYSGESAPKITRIDCKDWNESVKAFSLEVYMCKEKKYCRQAFMQWLKYFMLEYKGEYTYPQPYFHPDEWK